MLTEQDRLRTVQPELLRRVVGDLDAGGLVEGHVPVGVQVLAVAAGLDREAGVHLAPHGVARQEEVADGALDGRRLGALEEDAKHEQPAPLAVGGGDRGPDVAHLARARKVGQHARLVRLPVPACARGARSGRERTGWQGGGRAEPSSLFSMSKGPEELRRACIPIGALSAARG